MTGMGKDPGKRQSKPPTFDEINPDDFVGQSIVIFTVWDSADDGDQLIKIDGGNRTYATWCRPCIGTEKGVPIVNVEGDPSAAMTAPNYLEWVFGEEFSKYIDTISSGSRSVNRFPLGEAPTITEGRNHTAH